MVFCQTDCIAETKDPANLLYSSKVISLDGDGWLLATDPQNVGRQQQWWAEPQSTAKPTKVPRVIQDTFPGYYGVAWYWRDIEVPVNPHPQGRYLLRFWAVNFRTDVWVNGCHVGEHEGGEDPFVLDVTDAVRPETGNRLAVRVLNPGTEPIDGISLKNIPHRNREGGIMDSVELIAAPAMCVEDLYVRPDPETGLIHIQTNVRNALKKRAIGYLVFTVAPAASGETLDVTVLERDFEPGDTLIESTLQVDNPHLWDTNAPYLYRVTSRLSAARTKSFDEKSTRCGFRDFRFKNGYFRLNGRRIYVRGSLLANWSMVGLKQPHELNLVRKDLINLKAMGFNTVRFCLGIPPRCQLDLCDEIGLLALEESYAAWALENSPRMPEYFNKTITGMIRRDRNHPSIVMWGLLNEESNTLLFHHAVSSLGLIRSLDDSRMVILNSGRFDNNKKEAAQSEGPPRWLMDWRHTPYVAGNNTGKTIEFAGSAWAPGQLALAPGGHQYFGGQYSVICWRAPEAGEYATG